MLQKAVGWGETGRETARALFFVGALVGALAWVVSASGEEPVAPLDTAPLDTAPLNGAPSGAAQPAADRLTGHGGPVKSVATYQDPTGRTIALTASFDNAIGFWDAASGERLLWLEGHDAAVNAVAFTPNGAAAVSASDDFAVRYWAIQSGLSSKLSGHEGKVADVAVSPDGRVAASAAWDGSIGLWSLPQDRSEKPASLGFLEGHRGAVNAVVFSTDGQSVLSASADGTVRRWRVADGAPIRTEVEHGFSVNVLLRAPDESWFAYGSADGVVRVIETATGKEIAALTGDRRPILALALSPSGQRLAYGDGQGFITTVKVAGWEIERDFRAAARGPIWALAWSDEDHLLAAGLDDSVAIWPVTGETPTLLASAAARFLVDPATVSNGERQFARKCSVCHTLTPGHGRRAGPSLHGVFGRKIGTAAGYRYSPELVAMDIVWDEKTIDKLFDLGPDVFTPGSKMPVQRITGAEDRADLIAYLKAATSAPETDKTAPQ